MTAFTHTTAHGSCFPCPLARLGEPAFAPQSNTRHIFPVTSSSLRYHDSSRLAGIQRIMVTLWGWEDAGEKGLGLLTSLGDTQKARRCLWENWVWFSCYFFSDNGLLAVFPYCARCVCFAPSRVEYAFVRRIFSGRAIAANQCIYCTCRIS
jgi:hypothetical protein